MMSGKTIRIIIKGILSILLMLQSAIAGENHTLALKQSHQLEIPFDDCATVENTLGQLFYIFVDNNGVGAGEDDPAATHAIHPAYIQLVKELNIGGVRPDFSPKNLKPVLTSLKALKNSTSLPLLIGDDYVTVILSNGKRVSVGQGHGDDGGYLNRFSSLDPSCRERLNQYESIVQKTLGINLALGPIVQNKQGWGGLLSRPAEEVASQALPLMNTFKKTGVAVTLKHFPFVPGSYDLHEKSSDTQDDHQSVSNRIEIFKQLAPQADFVMTTHVYDSLIDPDNLVTFSKEWMRILRQEVGFKGLVMTDGLFMIRRYDATMKEMLRKWATESGSNLDDLDSVFAAKAILAGHDFIMLEGTASDTRKVFNNLHTLACQSSPIGKELRSRIAESYERISKFKRDNAQSLNRQINVPESLLIKLQAWQKGLDQATYTEEFKPRSGGKAYCESGAWEKLLNEL